MELAQRLSVKARRRYSDASEQKRNTLRHFRTVSKHSSTFRHCGNALFGPHWLGQDEEGEQVRYIFDRFEFDDRNNRLSCNQKPVHARPKVIALLGLLVRQRARVVARQELLDQLWPEVRVGGTSLSTLLNETRRALGDSGDRQRIIRTESGRGYRFISPVEVRPDRTPDRYTSGNLASPRWHGETWVHDHLDLTLEDLPRGGARHLLIRGEMGTGKSHLLHDLVGMAAQRGLPCFKALCLRPPENLPLAPWKDLRSLIEASERRPAAGALRREPSDPRLSAAPKHNERDRQTLRPVVPAPTVSTICAEIRAWAAGSGPALLLIEDLHWADRASLLALERLALGLAREPLLLVGTLRSTYAMGPPWRRNLLDRILSLHCTDLIELNRMCPTGNKLFRASGPMKFHADSKRGLQSTLRTGRAAIRNGDLPKALTCLETALEICRSTPEFSRPHAPESL